MKLIHEYEFGLDWFRVDGTWRDAFYYDPHPKSRELRRADDDSFLNYFPSTTAAIAHLRKNGHTIA